MTAVQFILILPGIFAIIMLLVILAVFSIELYNKNYKILDPGPVLGSMGMATLCWVIIGATAKVWGFLM